MSSSPDSSPQSVPAASKPIRYLDGPHPHDGYVQTIFSEPRRYFAVCCGCGSDPFPDRDTPDEAAADHARHTAAHSPASSRYGHEMGTPVDLSGKAFEPFPASEPETS